MLIKETTNNVINTEEVSRGTLIWAKHSSWEDGISGIAEYVDERKIVVRFLPTTQNVQNHFMMLAKDISGGSWTVRYSNDGMETVLSYGGTESGEENTGENTEQNSGGEDSGSE